MTKYIILTLLFFVGFALARPADKLSKDDFNVNNFLKKTRIQMVSNRVFKILFKILFNL